MDLFLFLLVVIAAILTDLEIIDNQFSYLRFRVIFGPI